MNHHAKQLGASLMLCMLDIVEQAPEGASVVCGGTYMRKSDGWTPEAIAKRRAQLQAIIDSPPPPGEPVIWHDRIREKS